MSVHPLLNGEQNDDSTDGKLHQEKEFSKLDLPKKQTVRAEFYKCKFISCNLFQSKFIECDFEDCTFESCDLSLAMFQNSRLLDVSFSKTKLLGVDWKNLRNPSRYRFTECKLDGSNFFKMTIPQLHMQNCSARECDFSEANLTKGEFTGTDFLGSRFSQTNLSFADFSDAINYAIDPNKNKLKKTVFCHPEVTTLLNYFDIVIK